MGGLLNPANVHGHMGEAKRRASKSRQDFEENQYVAVVLNPVSTCEQTQGAWQGAAVKCRLPSNRTA